MNGRDLARDTIAARHRFLGFVASLRALPDPLEPPQRPVRSVAPGHLRDARHPDDDVRRTGPRRVAVWIGTGYRMATIDEHGRRELDR